jgi:hypothetical protein
MNGTGLWKSQSLSDDGNRPGSFETDGVRSASGGCGRKKLGEGRVLVVVLVVWILNWEGTLLSVNFVPTSQPTQIYEDSANIPKRPG